MTQPPGGAAPSYGQYDATAPSPAGPASSDAGPPVGPSRQWVTPQPPSWAPPWQPPTPPPPGGPIPAATAGRMAASRSRLVLALVAGVGVLVGAVGAGVVVTALFMSSAEDIGGENGAEMAPGLEDGIADGLSRGMTESLQEALAFAERQVAGAVGGASGPVEQFPPVEPVDLGADPVLDAYANTCGGRVREFAVMTCTELE